jgi:hypothetical protein
LASLFLKAKVEVKNYFLPLRKVAPVLAILLFVCVVGRVLFPYPQEIKRATQGQGAAEVSLPYWVSGPILRSEPISFSLDLPFVHATRFRLWGDDCIHALRVNGTVVAGFPYCDWGKSVAVDLSGYLRTGLNQIEVEISNEGGPGGLSFVVDGQDPVLLGYRAALLLLIGIAVFLFVRQLNLSLWLSATFVGATWVRIIYFWLTPARVRAYDLDGHVEYVKFLVERLAIPRSGQGWEFHQPPLYYFLGSLATRTSHWSSPSFQAELDSLQLFSLLLSLGTFALGAAGVLLLIRGRIERLSAILILAFLPGLIFSAGRISNDTLYHFFAFLWFVLLVKWWQSPSRSGSFAACAALVCAALTKLSALPLIAASFVVILSRRGASVPSRLALLGGNLLMLVAGIGWYFYLRLVAGDSFAGSERLSALNGGLAIPNTWESLFTFNPRELLMAPFNHPFEDGSRRSYFLEYFFKSAFFGEFRFPEVGGYLTGALLVCGLLFLLYAVWGLVRAALLKEKSLWPTVVVGAALFSSLLLLRFQYPFSPHQDFRFIHLVMLPFCVCAAYGSSSHRVLQRGLLFLSLFFALASSAFVLRLSLVPGPV